MYRRISSLIAVFVVGIAAGSIATYLIVSSKLEELAATTYLRNASDARSFAQALEEIRAQQDAQAISRLEGYLAAALISLGDYESSFPLDKRDPQIYEALATVRKYVARHPEVTLPPAAESVLAMGSAEDSR